MSLGVELVCDEDVFGDYWSVEVVVGEQRQLGTWLGAIFHLLAGVDVMLDGRSEFHVVGRGFISGVLHPISALSMRRNWNSNSWDSYRWIGRSRYRALGDVAVGVM